MTLPTNTRFGVEIECLIPANVSRAQVVAAIVARGVPCVDAGYTHRVISGWKLVTDGSLRADVGTYGMEIVSPPMSGDEGERQTIAVGEVLIALGCKVNRTCGLHVHIDATNMSVDEMRRLAVIYAHAEPMIDSLMPSSRRGNANVYCQSITRASRERIARANNAGDLASVLAGGQRYAKLNFAAFWRHRTVEFRHHSGTCDPHKILNWVKMCLRLADFARTATTSFVTGAAMPSNVRAGTKRALLLELLMRPSGATRNEMLAATNARTLSLGALSRAAGVSIHRGRRISGGFTRYYANVQGSTPTVATQVALPSDLPMTFADFCTRLNMSSDEMTFWNERREFLASALNPGE